MVEIVFYCINTKFLGYVVILFLSLTDIISYTTNHMHLHTIPNNVINAFCILILLLKSVITKNVWTNSTMVFYKA